MQTRTVGSALVLTLSASSLVALAACSSSSHGDPAGGDGDSGFNFVDAGDDAKKTTTHPHDATAPVDTGTKPKVDAGCGTSSGSDWCNTNAPALTEGSNVLCDDFDRGELSSVYYFSGVTSADLVDTHYVSPYCALVAEVDKTNASEGAFTQHAYQQQKSSAGATAAFDLYVPGGSSCEGAYVMYFVVYPQVEMPPGAIDAWLTISDITGASGAATGYTVGLDAYAGAFPVKNAGKPVTVKVTPDAADKGWARISVDLSEYTFAATPTASSAKGTVAWSHIGAKKVAATSTELSITGMIAPITPVPTITLDFDLGIMPDITTDQALVGCQIYVDDFVTNTIAP